ncbi:hypothetical protein [Pseudomonas chlororaphis]|uniref:hypothetical protein n=1 Tax=Pseudomonas chlororaphis TaxID=587753 RepID=UPI00131A5CAA|nr:hypothetical protein [Pseudomonas chlororaphis]
MRRRGNYYMARVIKFGQLNQQKLMDAISEAPVVAIGQFEWTITDVVDMRGASEPFMFGNLAKYSREGHVTVVDEPAKQQLTARAPYLLEASAPFIYLPDFSGLAFLHVWNGIQENVFPRRFKAIVEAAYDNFFVGCTVEPVTDYRAFLERLKTLDSIKELSAKVSPPNPLFGRLWGGLDEYVRKRQADEVSVRESTSKSQGLSTDLLELIENILLDPNYQPAFEPDITDAAVLMAADGYGSGKAVGTEEGVEVVIRTSESQKSFLFDKDPDPELLANIVRGYFERVSSERDMRH